MSNTPSTPPPDPHSPTSEDWITRTRWIMYGAATTLVESLQDLEKGKATWQKVATADWPHLAEELATKGETTEQEARRYVEQMMNQPSSPPSDTPSEPMDSQVDSQPGSPSVEPPISGTDPATPPAPPAPSGSGSVSGSSGVSSDEILELMDLTRQIESLRLDLERKRLEHPDP